MMSEEYAFTICCLICGTVLGKSFRGSRTITKCPKCSAELFYQTKGNGTEVTLTKEPKNMQEVPSISNYLHN